MLVELMVTARMPARSAAAIWLRISASSGETITVGPAPCGAQQRGGDEVDRRLAPAGALHDQRPAPVDDQRLDRRPLVVAQRGRRRGRPARADAPRPAGVCRSTGHRACLPAAPDRPAALVHREICLISRADGRSGICKVKHLRDVVSFTVLGDDRNGKEPLKSFAQSRSKSREPPMPRASARRLCVVIAILIAPWPSRFSPARPAANAASRRSLPQAAAHRPAGPDRPAAGEAREHREVLRGQRELEDPPAVAGAFRPSPGPCAPRGQPARRPGEAPGDGRRPRPRLGQAPRRLAGQDARDLDGSAGTVPRFWTGKFGKAYAALQKKLAARYDGNSTLAEVVISRCTTFYAEPFIRQTSITASRKALKARRLHQAPRTRPATRREINAHRVWQRTRAGLAFNPAQFVTAQRRPHRRRPVHRRR